MSLSCIQCGRSIRSIDKARFLFLRPDGRTEEGTIECWVHQRCVDDYNAGAKVKVEPKSVDDSSTDPCLNGQCPSCFPKEATR